MKSAQPLQPKERHLIMAKVNVKTIHTVRHMYVTTMC